MYFLCYAILCHYSCVCVCVCVYIIMALLLIAILLFRELNSTRKPKLCFKNSLNVKRLDKLKEELAELSYNRACKNINIAH